MVVDLTCNRECLQYNRPNYFFFMIFEVFPRTDGNPDYPGTAPIIADLRKGFDQFGAAHAAKNTSLADEIYQDILTNTSGLMKNIQDNCGNVVSKLEETGFTANKTKGTPAPVTGKVLNVNSMALGGQKMKFEYEGDANAHFFLARIRLKGGTDADWVMNGRSENQTMIISTGFTHGLDYEIQICGNGTKGAGDWSDVKSFLVD